MAINSQKLLPPSKSAGGKIVKADGLSLVEKQLINVDKLFKNNLILQKKTIVDNKKVIENEKRNKEETKLERKKETDKFKFKAPSLPKTGFLDAIQNFISYTFLGYLIGNYYEYLPKLIQFSKNIVPVVQTLEKIVVGTFEATVGLIDLGYKSHDEIKKLVTSIGGQDAQTKFDSFAKNFKDLINRIMTLGLYNPSQIPTKSNGGYVEKLATGGNVTTRGGRVVGGAISRQIKVIRSKTPPKIKPQLTKPGKDVGGKERIKTLFADPSEGLGADPGVRSPLRSLKTTSESLKTIPLLGGIMGAAVDISMGQRPNPNVYTSFGNAIGAIIQNTIDNQMSSSSGDIAKAVYAMAAGGSVPLDGRSDIGYRVGVQVGSLLATLIGSKINEIFSKINRELSLKEIPPTPYGPGAGGGVYGQYTPEGIQGDIYQYLISKGLDDVHALGIMANISRESGFRIGAIGDNGTSGGLFQWHAGRFARMQKAIPNWQNNWRAQVDYALAEKGEPGPRYTIMKFSSAQEAADWWMRNWERPAEYIQSTEGPKIHAEYLSSVQKYKTKPGQIQIGKLTGSLSSAKSLAESMGLQVTSYIRPGDPGYHGKGRAMDFSGDSDAQMRFAQEMIKRHGTSISQLIYTPLGFGIANGKQVGLDYWGAKTNAQHYDHVHVAFAKGGLVSHPTRAIVGEKGPEFIFDADTTRNLSQLAPGLLNRLNVAKTRREIDGILQSYADYEGSGKEIVFVLKEKIVQIGNPSPANF